MKASSLLLLSAISVLFGGCANKAEISSQQAKISGITVQVKEEGYEYTYRYALEHDEKGRITKAEPDHSEDFGVTCFEYGSDTFRIGKGEGMYAVFSLDEQGNLLSTKEEEGFSMVIDEMFLRGTMAYNDKGQLEAIRYPGHEEKIDFVWEEDNLMQMNIEGEHIDFTYTGLENKNNFGFMVRIDDNTRTPVFPYYGLLGKPTRNLPESIGQDGAVITFEYKTNKSGYIEEMTMVYPGRVKVVCYTFRYGEGQ